MHPFKINVPAGTGKANEVVVNDVHVCCGQCKKAINKLFEGKNVSYEGKGPQLAVTIQGENLQVSEILDALRKTGFNGTVK